MKNKTILLGVIAVSTLMLTSVVMAGKQTSAWNGLNHRGKTSHLYLYEKDQNTWEIIDGGAWGKMTFSDEFVFNGHGLEVGKDYTLIYYPDFDNKYKLELVCTSGCSGTYTHTMNIVTFDENGFTGTGFYNANTGYTWDVTGTSKDTFTLVYTGLNSGYKVTCISGSCTGPGQTFNLVVTDIGSAVWPHPVEILGEGTANKGGNVNIKGTMLEEQWSVDTNEGAKIWLVLSSDIDDNTISGWNPTEYLFEYDLI